MEHLSKKVSDGIEDRLTGLPENVHDRILSSMPICDAVRTSILSRTWRYIWTSISKVKFDERFFEDKTIKKKDIMSFPKVVNDVLLMHEGSILEFSLRIPNHLFDLSVEINRWLLLLSRNGINRLEIQNLNQTTYKLPSSIFLCKTLTYLSVLNNCVLKPPHGFTGFQNLVALDLMSLSFDANVSSNLLFNALQLQTLSFSDCTGVEHLRIHAPKLDNLHVFECGDVNWEWFERRQQLNLVDIILSKEVISTNGHLTINLEKFIGNLPKVSSLCLDGFSLKFLAAHRVPPTLPTPAQSLRNLALWSFAVSDFYQISSSLCLLRSSPNLEDFAILVDNGKETLVEPVICCLDASIREDMKLEKLKAVGIGALQGTKIELLLVKLLLACSPSLERMDVGLSTKIDISERYRVSKEVARFSRASQKAEVIITESDIFDLSKV